MVKNWSKIVLVSTLVLVLGASLAFASTSRVRSLANAGDYMSDDSNLFRWYSTLPSYANMVQAELGHWWGASDGPVSYDESDYPLLFTRGLGINHACGDEGKYGTYRVSLIESTIDAPGFHVVNPMMMFLTPWAATSYVDMPYSVTPVNKWDAAGGWEIGENITAGLSITRSSWKWEDEQLEFGDPLDKPVEELSSSFTTIGVGGSWSNNEDIIIDGAFTYGMAGGEWTGIGGEADSSVEWDSKNAMDIAIRAFWDWKEYVTVVPVFEYATANYAMKRAPTDYDHSIEYIDNGVGADAGDKISAINFGVGLNMEVNGDNMIIFAAEFNNMSWEPSNPDTFETKWSMTSLPVLRLALESQINSWLTTRIGAVHYNYRVTETDSEGKELKYTNGAIFPDLDGGWYGDWESHFEWTLGAGFNVAEWTVDMELAPETPFSLGYWLTGYTAWPQDNYDGNREWAGPVWRISATYNFQ